ncbi:MAG: tRNA 2-thiouridine(34) synthase MnmA [Alphaproteobacteria bacterium]|nr:tRNA 2-thiouridine(34) synthase MnmA [Alphaproteobacteria bacterium]
MSGGVDSAVTAALLHRAGFGVVGVTLQLYDQGAAAGRKGACCAGQDIADARRAADMLGIPHYVLDFEARFRRDVIEPFADAYAAGATPVPCAACNQTVKFRDLAVIAADLGAQAVATGHYARRAAGPAEPELHAAADPARDQSYFLYGTTRAQLALLRFPLGGMAKARTRAIAGRLGLPVAAKPDSQDICFVPSGRYDALVARLRPDAMAPGDIVDLDGRALGRHDGIGRFTVGQRKGLGLAPQRDDSEALYVVRLEPEAGRVVVGPRAALARAAVALGPLNWLGDAPPDPAGERVTVKLRSSQPPAAATLRASDGAAAVTLDAPAIGVAPGQACVLYRGSRVLGGAVILRPPAG